MVKQWHRGYWLIYSDAYSLSITESVPPPCRKLRCLSSYPPKSPSPSFGNRKAACMTGRSWIGCCGSRPAPESLYCCAVISKKEWSCPWCSGQCPPLRSRKIAERYGWPDYHISDFSQAALRFRAQIYEIFSN